MYYKVTSKSSTYDGLLNDHTPGLARKRLVCSSLPLEGLRSEIKLSQNGICMKTSILKTKGLLNNDNEIER
jgi:hypothetical protein